MQLKVERLCNEGSVLNRGADLPANAAGMKGHLSEGGESGSAGRTNGVGSDAAYLPRVAAAQVLTLGLSAINSDRALAFKGYTGSPHVFLIWMLVIHPNPQTP